MLAFFPPLAASRRAAKEAERNAIGYDPAGTLPRILIRHLSLKHPRKKLIRGWKIRRALAAVAAFPRNPDAPKHSLDAPLIVSLTSYPKRFRHLHLTVKSLLDQTVRPDRIVLWIAHQDMEQLPAELRALEGDVFQIRGCEDLRNFKKILPTLEAFPGSYVVICDDDTYYPQTWLKRLVDSYDPDHPSVVCHRAHWLRYSSDGQLAPYRTWKRNAWGAATRVPRTDLLPTGNGGVLYPPGSLPQIATDRELIRRLSPTSDDIWLYFMWRQAGWKVRRVPGRRRWFVEWPESQETALHAFHRGGSKDQHIRDMAAHFGVP